MASVTMPELRCRQQEGRSAPQAFSQQAILQAKQLRPFQHGSFSKSRRYCERQASCCEREPQRQPTLQREYSGTFFQLSAASLALPRGRLLLFLRLRLLLMRLLLLWLRLRRSPSGSSIWINRLQAELFGDLLLSAVHRLKGTQIEHQFPRVVRLDTVRKERHGRAIETS